MAKTFTPKPVFLPQASEAASGMRGDFAVRVMRGVLAVLVAVLAWGAPFQGAANAQESELFTITGVRVDVTADNAVEAREKALGKARRDAFGKLADRLLTGDERSSVQNADDITINSMIRNFEIEKEKLSSVRYIATISVVFDETAVRAFFNNSGDSYTATTRRPVLVLPWYVENGQNKLWQDSNPWSESWRHMADSGTSIVPFVAPMGDIMDVRDFSPASPLAYDDQALKQLQTRYGVDDSIIVIAQPAGDVISIQIYTTSDGFPAQVKVLSVSAGNGAGNGTSNGSSDAWKIGVEQVLAFLRSDWKAKTAVDSEAALQSYALTAHYADLRGWIALRDALQSIQGVENLSIKSVSPQKADITLDFRGDINTMAVLFDRYRIGMSQSQQTAPAPSPYGQPSYSQTGYDGQQGYGQGYGYTAAPQNFVMQYDIFLKNR